MILLNKITDTFARLKAQKYFSTVLVSFGMVALYIFCALFPLSFRHRESVGDISSYSDRAFLFAEYWAGMENGYSVEIIREIDEEDDEFCSKRTEELARKVLVDNGAESLEPEGSEYVRLSGNGESIRVCRKWIRVLGDWQNWFDVCFDMDTGEVYYLYTSNECVFNAAEYDDVIDENADCKSFAKQIALHLDARLINFDWSGEDDEFATALYKLEGGTVLAELRFICYDSALYEFSYFVSPGNVR